MRRSNFCCGARCSRPAGCRKKGIAMLLTPKTNEKSPVQKLPPELLRSAPRQVRLTAAGIALLVSAVVVFAGAWFLGIWLYVQATQPMLPVEGQITEVTHALKEPRLVVEYS